MRNKIRSWSQEAKPSTVNIVAWILAAIMIGCYIYAGILITKLF